MTKQGLNRRQIREKAIQAQFQMMLNADLSMEDAMLNALNVSEEEVAMPTVYALEHVPYLVTIMTMLEKNKEVIDEKIKEQLENWTLERITKIDLAILRLAVYEMFFEPDENVPKKVAINEAIELAKLYSDDKAPKFVNGILSGMIKE